MCVRHSSAVTKVECSLRTRARFESVGPCTSMETIEVCLQCPKCVTNDDFRLFYAITILYLESGAKCITTEFGDGIKTLGH